MKALNTGRKIFTIPFDNGDKIILEFNPTDYKFYTLYLQLTKNVGKIFLEFEETAKSSFGEKEVALYEETEKKIKEEFDKVFGVGAGDQIFKYCSPVSIVDGQYYPFYFLEAFEPEIVSVMNEKAKKSAEKAKKYKESDV